MASYCKKCNEKMGWFSKKEGIFGYCSECEKEIKAKGSQRLFEEVKLLIDNCQYIEAQEYLTLTKFQNLQTARLFVDQHQPDDGFKEQYYDLQGLIYLNTKRYDDAVNSYKDFIESEVKGYGDLKTVYLMNPKIRDFIFKGVHAARISNNKESLNKIGSLLSRLSEIDPNNIKILIALSENYLLDNIEQLALCRIYDAYVIDQSETYKELLDKAEELKAFHEVKRDHIDLSKWFYHMAEKVKNPNVDTFIEGIGLLVRDQNFDGANKLTLMASQIDRSKTIEGLRNIGKDTSKAVNDLRGKIDSNSLAQIQRIVEWIKHTIETLDKTVVYK